MCPTKWRANVEGRQGDKPVGGVCGVRCVTSDAPFQASQVGLMDGPAAVDVNFARSSSIHHGPTLVDGAPALYGAFIFPDCRLFSRAGREEKPTPRGLVRGYRTQVDCGQGASNGHLSTLTVYAHTVVCTPRIVYISVDDAEGISSTDAEVRQTAEHTHASG